MFKEAIGNTYVHWNRTFEAQDSEKVQFNLLKFVFSEIRGNKYIFRV